MAMWDEYEKFRFPIAYRDEKVCDGLLGLNIFVKKAA
jgi:hypothetical protein